MGTRIAAGVVAVAMVVASIAIRGRIDAGSTSLNGRVACSAELVSVCAAAGMTDDPESLDPADLASDPAEAAAALDGDSGRPLDALLMAEPWIDLSDALRPTPRPTIPAVSRTPVASSRVAIVMWSDRAAAVQARCGLKWGCVADVAALGTWAAAGGNASWGRVKLGVEGPETTRGLAAIGTLAVASFGGTGFGRAEIQSDDAWRRRSAAFASARSDGGLATMLAAGPALTDAVVALAPDIEAARDTPRFRDVIVIYPEPVTRVTLTLVTPATDAGRALSQRLAPVLARELEKAGWGPPEPAVFPDGGVVAALLEDWRSHR